MSTERKSEAENKPSHKEKQTMDQPQEEFIADQSVPSHAMGEAEKRDGEDKSVRKGEAPKKQ